MMTSAATSADQQHSNHISRVSTVVQPLRKTEKLSLQLSSSQPYQPTFVIRNYDILQIFPVLVLVVIVAVVEIRIVCIFLVFFATGVTVCRESEVVGTESGIVDAESGVAHSGPSTGIPDDRDYNVEALTSFWAALSPSEDQLRGLLIVFIKGVIYGPVRAILGVRDRLDPSITDGNSPIALVFRETGAQTMRNSRCVSWEPVEDSKQIAWDKFTKEISDDIEKKWPQSLRGKAIPKSPSHFVYDSDCFQGALVTLTELSYNEHGFPRQVHRYLPQQNNSIPEIPKGRSMAIYASSGQPQPAWRNEIFGRSWCARPSIREF